MVSLFKRSAAASILLLAFLISCSATDELTESVSIHFPLPPATAIKGRARHVVLISVDGLRPDAIDEAGARTLLALRRAGAHCLKAQTVRPSVTLPSHASMLTGLDVSRHGVTWNSYRTGAIGHPTIFSVASAANLSTAMLFSKSKFCYLARPGSVHWIFGPMPQGMPALSESAQSESPRPAPKGQSSGFSKVDPSSGPAPRSVAWESSANALSSAFSQEWPRASFQLTFIHLRDVDQAGHRSGWMSAPYLDAVRKADEAIGAIVETIRRAGKLEETAIIITSDHGGSGTGHESVTDPARPEHVTIPWICVGPGVKPGLVIDRVVHTYDTAPTALALLGLDPPIDLDGAPVAEVLR